MDGIVHCFSGLSTPQDLDDALRNNLGDVSHN